MHQWNIRRVTGSFTPLSNITGGDARAVEGDLKKSKTEILRDKDNSSFKTFS
jgi:hypothetical protein